MASTQSQTPDQWATLSENKEPTLRGVDRGWAWFVCLASHLCEMLTFGYFGSLGVLYVEWKAYFDSSATTSSWLISMHFAVACPFSPIFGVIAPRVGVRRMAIAGSLVSALATILGSFATSLWQLYVTSGLSGLGLGMLLPSAFIMLTRYFKKRFALASMIAILGVNVGQMIFPPLFRVLIMQYGWKGAMFIFGAIQMNLIPASGLFRPQKAETAHRPRRNGLDGVKYIEALKEGRSSSLPLENIKKGHTLDQTKGIEGSPSLPSKDSKMAGHPHQKGLSLDQAQQTEETELDKSPSFLSKDAEMSDHLRELLSDEARQIEETTGSGSSPVLQSKPAKNYRKALLEYLAFLGIFSNISFTLLQIAFFMYALAWITNVVHLPSRSKEAGWTDDQGASLITILAVASIVARLFQGFVVDRGYIGPFKLLLCGLFGATLVTLLNPSFDSYIFLVVAAAVLGACLGVSTPLLVVCVRAVVSHHHVPAAMSWCVAGPSLSSAIGSVVAGKVFDLTGNYMATFLLAGGMFLASFLSVFAVFILKTRKRALKPRVPSIQLSDQPGNTTEQSI